MNKCCKDFDSFYQGKRLKDLPELEAFLEEEFTDYKTWTTYYKCKICGDRWVEKYVDKGHGEIPIVERLSENISGYT